MVTLEQAEIGLWLALTCWVVGFICALHSLVFKKEASLKLAVIFAATGLLPHAVGMALRWVASGRPPFINLYELVATSAWFAVATFLIIQLIWRFARPVAVIVLPVAFLSMGATLTLSPEANALSPGLKSWWLVIHILFAMLAHGCFAVAFGGGILYLRCKPVASTDEDSLIPSEVRLNQLINKCIIFGFICDTVMILSGGIWANRAWGRFWGWDPIETWSLVTWLIYGLYVHLCFLKGWKGRKAAIYATAAFLVVLFSFWGVPHLWNSIHDYTLYAK